MNPIEERISVDPHVCSGKPCIKGTRTPVYIILEALAMNMSYDEIKREYGPLNDEDIQSCLYYAAFLADEQEVVTSSNIK